MESLILLIPNLSSVLCASATGLLAAVELVKDRDTKEKFPKEAKLGEKLNKIMNERGLLGRAGDIISISPPLCITKDEVDWLVQQLDEGIAEVESQL